ncbi:hypothetical protein Tco_0404983 [Tanacetum coccineum]
MGKGLAMPIDPHHTPTFIQPSPQPQKTQKPRRPKKKDTQVPQSSVPSDNVADEAVYKELDDSLVRAATTASSLKAEQDSGNITKTRSKATLNEPSSSGTSSGSGTRRQETIGDTIAQTRFENVSKISNDPLLARGNTLQSDEDSLKLNELMELCTNIQQRVLDLETTKNTQANEIASLKRRVKKLKNKDRSRTHKLKRLYKVGLSAKVESSGDEEDLVNDYNEIFDVDTLAGEEVFVAEQSGNVVEEVVAVIDATSIIPISAATITDVEITLAQALAELKSEKPKANKVVIQELEQGKTTTTPTTIILVPKPPQDKGKGIMIEEPVAEQVKPMKRLEQMRLDEELVFKLQADNEIFDVDTLAGEEVFIAEQNGNVVEEVVVVIASVSTIPVSAATITDVEITLAQALAELKSAKPKADKVVIQEPEQEPVVEQVKPINRLKQMRLDEELAFNLQAEEEEEERLSKEKAQQIKEANIAWDDFQAKLKADYQLAQRLQAQEQEELIDEEKARLFVQFLEQRRKHFAAKRAEEKRNRPPTRAQQRNIMCTYLKNIKGWKPKSLKNKSFVNIQEFFEKAMKRVNTFVDYRTELVEEKVTKKQKVDDVQEKTEMDNDQEAAKIKELMEIVPDKEEVAIDVIPLAVKPPSIIDWRIHKEWKKTYY